jgi:hypothetical protein
MLITDTLYLFGELATSRRFVQKTHWMEVHPGLELPRTNCCFANSQ